MTTLSPKITTGVAKGAALQPRADFRPDEFDRLIVTKGYRLWWSRAGQCPCTGNEQTEQPDPVCSLCKGLAWFYFCPDAAVAAGAKADTDGNPIDVSDDGKSIAIQANMTSLTRDTKTIEKFGEWVTGTARVSTQAKNKLAFRDRLVSVDSTMAWQQVIVYAGGSVMPVTGSKSKAGTRYPVVDVNLVRSVTTLYRQNVDYFINPQSALEWLPGREPKTGTRLSVHYLMRPTWIVTEHINSYRDSLGEAGSTDPRKQKVIRLPMQAMAKLDFLIAD